MNYAEQYKSPHWQKKRLEMLSGAAYTCELCGDTETQLHVHHRFYRAGAKIWEYENYELAVLCEECHSMVHGKNQNFTEEDYWFMACFLAFVISPPDCVISPILTDTGRRALDAALVVHASVINGEKYTLDGESEGCGRLVEIVLNQTFYRSCRGNSFSFDAVKTDIAHRLATDGLVTPISAVDWVSMAFPYYVPSGWVYLQNPDNMYIQPKKNLVVVRKSILQWSSGI